MIRLVKFNPFVFLKNKNQLKLSWYTTCTGKKVQTAGISVPVTQLAMVLVTTTNFEHILALVQTRTQKFKP